jgi:hypothetical protein
MKFTAVAQTKKPVLSIAGIFFLLFFLGGCVTSVSQVGQITKCRQAEQAVNTAQKQFDDSILDLAKKPTDQTLKNNVPAKVKSLLEAEEKAYQMCHRVS